MCFIVFYSRTPLVFSILGNDCLPVFRVPSLHGHGEGGLAYLLKPIKVQFSTLQSNLAPSALRKCRVLRDDVVFTVNADAKSARNTRAAALVFSGTELEIFEERPAAPGRPGMRLRTVHGWVSSRDSRGEQLLERVTEAQLVGMFEPIASGASSAADFRTRIATCYPYHHAEAPTFVPV